MLLLVCDGGVVVVLIATPLMPNFWTYGDLCGLDNVALHAGLCQHMVVSRHVGWTQGIQPLTDPMPLIWPLGLEDGVPPV